MYSRFFCLCVIVNFFNSATSARILAIAVTPAYSHQVTYRPLWRALHERGHEITLITSHTMNDESLVNITEISMGEGARKLLNEIDYYQRVVDSDGHLYTLWNLVVESAFSFSDTLMTQPEVDNLLHNSSLKFDVAIIEAYNYFLTAFAAHFKIPNIVISTIEIDNFYHGCIGNGFHPIQYPDPFMPYGEELSYMDRVKVGFTTIAWPFVQRMGKSDRYMEKYFGKGYPGTWELMCNIDLMLLDIHPVLTTIRPTTPLTVTLGDGMQIDKSINLTQELQEYLDGCEEGAIYFSLGTNILSKYLKEPTKKMMLEVFSELPYKILWKYEGEDLKDLPPNVKLSKWLPQYAVLRHPNVKLFLMQGGVVSIKESVLAHVPMVGLPFFIDQHSNVKKLETRGMGLALDPVRMEKSEFKAAILEVIQNKKYKEATKHIAELILDEPMTGLEKAVWWTEYVIRHNGTQHLRPRKIPTYQYLLLDIIGTFTVLFVLYCYILKKLVLERLFRLAIKVRNTRFYKGIISTIRQTYDTHLSSYLSKTKQD